MNRSSKRKIWQLAAPLLAAVALAGCGGGGGGGGYYPPIVVNPPPEASAYDKFVQYVKDLVASAIDTAEPADVTAFDPPPTSETNEPVATQ